MYLLQEIRKNVSGCSFYLDAYQYFYVIVILNKKNMYEYILLFRLDISEIFLKGP